MGIEMRVPADAEQIIEKLNEHGFEAYVVGGCVRDSLLGKEPEDGEARRSEGHFQPDARHGDPARHGYGDA